MTKIEQAIFGKNGYTSNTKSKNKSKSKNVKKKAPLPTSMSSVELNQYLYENMSEEEHQKEFIKWLDSKGLYFEQGMEGIYLPNPHPKNSHAFRIQAASNRTVLKKMTETGMRRGVSDVKVYLEHICLHIELKRCNGGVKSPEQKNTHTIINSTSYAIHMFCNGVENAKNFVESFLEQKI